ncbi:hypothetical protein DAEQUDRAFT_761556, partial [Daedalea quercina L-15889]
MLLRANLRTQFLNMRYTPGANLHTELDRLRVKYEDLMTMDIIVSDAEYASLVINFLPDDLSTFISQISATAKLARRFQNAGITPLLADADVPAEEAPVLDAEALIEIALEEWDRRQGGRAAKAAKAKDAGVAASVLSSEKPRGKGRGCGGGPQRPVGVCWNCGGKGHRQDQCPSPKQDGAKDAQPANAAGKPDQSKQTTAKSKAGSANAAASTAASATLDEIAGAWSAYVAFDRDVSDDEAVFKFDSADEDARSDCTGLTEVSITSGDSMPSLRTVSDSTASEMGDLLDEVSTEAASDSEDDFPERVLDHRRIVDELNARARELVHQREVVPYGLAAASLPEA